MRRNRRQPRRNKMHHERGFSFKLTRTEKQRSNAVRALAAPVSLNGHCNQIDWHDYPGVASGPPGQAQDRDR